MDPNTLNNLILPAVLASNKKAKEILNWTPKFTLKDMILSTYKAYSYS